MVRVGETFSHKGVTVEIVEVAPYTSFANLRQLLVGYRIHDRAFLSPTAHFTMDATEDIRPRVEQVVDYYQQVKDSLLAGTK